MEMQKVKISTLSGAALDWAVATSQNWDVEIDEEEMIVFEGDLDHYAGDYCEPSKDWSLGGPIIETNMIGIKSDPSDGWRASSCNNAEYMTGEKPLIAAMRCYVHSMVGDEVEVPVQLLS